MILNSPYISGSLTVTNLSGSGVRYLMTSASGLLISQTADAAIKNTYTASATAGQTVFPVTNGYSTGLVDVYLNGTKLASSDYSDADGVNITLVTGSDAGDLLEFVKYSPALGVTNNALRQLTTFTSSEGQTVYSASYTPGLLDVYYNGSRLTPAEYTANNGTYITLATGSSAGDIIDMLVYSYQVGAFSGVGGGGVVNQIAFYNTTSSITGSNSFVVSGSSIGIGTNTPSSSLHLSTTNGVRLQYPGNTGFVQFSTNGSNDYVFSGYDGERMRLTSAGNLGINTNNPSRLLEISSSVGVPTLRLNNLAAGGNAGIEILTSPTKVSWLIGAQYNVDSALEITPSTANGGTTFTTPALTIKSTGIKLSGGSSYLNYYEEGTWTPSFTNSSTTPSHITQFGRYTRIGRIVHVVGKISASNLSGTGVIYVEGLPFTAADSGDSGQRVSIRPEGDWGGFSNTSQFSSTMFRINGTNFQGVKDSGSGSSAYATYNSYGSTINFNFHATYYV